jgi:MoxR-like ATPase
VYVDPLVKEYILALIDATRKHPDIYLGASPRGSLALYKTAQVRATIRGRDYVIPDDIKILTEPALAHRLIVSPAARLKNVDARAVVDELIHSVAVPGSRAAI